MQYRALTRTLCTLLPAPSYVTNIMNKVKRPICFVCILTDLEVKCWLSSAAGAVRSQCGCVAVNVH